MGDTIKTFYKENTVEVTLLNGKKVRIAKRDEDLFKKALKLDKSKTKEEVK
jgi:hypothetical protein